MSNARLRSLFSPFHYENQLIHPAARREQDTSARRERAASEGWL